MFGRQGQDGKALRQVFLQPRGEPGRAFDLLRDEFLELAFGGGAVGAVKNAADGPADFSALFEARDVGLGVLLEVELAALPRHGVPDGGAGGLEAGVVVADDELDAVQSALDEALEKRRASELPPR